MISCELAAQLAGAGLVWSPASGDRFMIPDRDLDAEVFVVSEMTIEVEQFSNGQLIRFNGTTEWALDSIPADQVRWLPREDQLRRALGERFDRLEARADGFRVVLVDGRFHDGRDAEDAYARALLEVLRAG
ncbi:pilus assembly protein CpaE [Enemella dayhoffiae]|uniref:Pilus assembly protein CpaE n=1 Tax=Enemella dayhoffiae TaxID=2016507 RepID=A0A255GUN1_9ACTN|nr:pilus assembly protein CpaE [Enemella dayhoffiae]OYO19409.1 pilus assembly protein CpaE [Enemella dayhoffiae]